MSSLFTGKLHECCCIKLLVNAFYQTARDKRSERGITCCLGERRPKSTSPVRVAQCGPKQRACIRRQGIPESRKSKPIESLLKKSKADLDIDFDQFGRQMIAMRGILQAVWGDTF